MRITVIRINGAPPQQPLAFDFDERGGGIGRDEGNELCLPDPQRHVSRQQARVFFDGQRFGLVDLGSNPTLVDGKPLGRGERQLLLGGELIIIGEYELEVARYSSGSVNASSTSLSSSAGNATDTDPLGLLVPQEAAGSLAQPFARSGAEPATASSDDPFAVFSVPVPPYNAATAPEPDPFAAPTPVLAPSPGHDLLGMERQTGPASIDDLFGLKDRSGDPFTGTPLEPALPAAVARENRDPLALFGVEGLKHPDASLSPQRDDTPLLEQSYRPPSPTASTVPATSVPLAPVLPEVDQSGPVNQVGAECPHGMVLSWDSGASSSSDVVGRETRSAPAAPVSEAVPVPPEPAAPAPSAAASPGRPASPMAAEQSLQQSTQRLAVDAPGDLLAAFQRGLGVPLKLPAGLTPELMEQVGIMLREATQGTLDLLKARAITKREVRAEATMIVCRDNNPLKFSPDIDFALSQLLTSHSKGFMGAQEAMRDAYDDLRAHQFGVMAGMRSALAGVLKRFEPAELEARVGALSLLDKLQPSGRKARLWDLFEQHYAELSREAADDFNALFGKVFLDAYQQQVDLMRERREQGGASAGR